MKKELIVGNKIFGSLASVILLASLNIASVAFAKTPEYQSGTKNTKRPATPTYSYDSAPAYAHRGDTPWNFSAMLGLYNPGVGFGGLAAYHITDSFLPRTSQSFYVESGLGFVSVSDTVAGSSVSYMLVEIPIQARWDFHLAGGKFDVGPRAGFNYLTGASVTVNGTSYTIARSSALYFQIGASGIYYFSDRFGVRAQIAFGGYTTLSVGLNFSL